jgi:serine-type D-Ala-D-Ala carboxypeptidase (penicillin-binding protein 5/6)
MGRRFLILSVVVTSILLGLVPAARAQQTTSPPYVPPTPRAYVLVDADTGAVLAERDGRVRFLPASTSKVITALVAVQHIAPGAMVPVSPRAEGMPARKINLKAGQQWKLEDLLHALLITSANDAAVALAQAAAGSDEGFVRLAAETARRLGMADDPVINDPAGLDDSFSFGGGNQISARDLAIAARALLAQPLLTEIVAKRDYRFVGGDGLPHRLTSHNRLLAAYPGAIGIKTGATDRAGPALIGAATREGRTMIAVVIKAPDTAGYVAKLLDQGFATPVAAQAGVNHLPTVPALRRPGPGTGEVAVAKAVPAGRTDVTPTSMWSESYVAVPLRAFGILAGLVALLRARVRSRRWLRRRRRAKVIASRRLALTSHGPTPAELATDRTHIHVQLVASSEDEALSTRR